MGPNLDFETPAPHNFNHIFCQLNICAVQYMFVSVVTSFRSSKTMLLILLMFQTLLASAWPPSHSSGAAKKYPVEDFYGSKAFAPLHFLSAENKADNGGVRVKRWTKKKRRNQRRKKRPKKGKGGKLGKRRPKPNQLCSKNPQQLKCTNKKMKRIEGQLNKFVSWSSMQKFKTNLRAEVVSATRVVPDLVRFKARVQQEIETNNLRLDEALASLTQV